MNNENDNIKDELPEENPQQLDETAKCEKAETENSEQVVENSLNDPKESSEISETDENADDETILCDTLADEPSEDEPSEDEPSEDEPSEDEPSEEINQTVKAKKPKKRILKKLIAALIVICLILGGVSVYAYVIPADCSKILAKTTSTLTSAKSGTININGGFEIVSTNNSMAQSYKFNGLVELFKKDKQQIIKLDFTVNIKALTVDVSTPLEMLVTLEEDGSGTVKTKIMNQVQETKIDPINNNKTNLNDMFKSQEDYESFLKDINNYFIQVNDGKNLQFSTVKQGFDNFNRTTEVNIDLNNFLSFLYNNVNFTDLFKIFNNYVENDNQISAEVMEQFSQQVASFKETIKQPTDIINVNKTVVKYNYDLLGKLNSQTFDFEFIPNIDGIFNLIDTMSNNKSMVDSYASAFAPISDIDNDTDNDYEFNSNDLSNSYVNSEEYQKLQQQILKEQLKSIEKISVNFEYSISDINKLENEPMLG